MSERLGNLQAQLGRHERQITELQDQLSLANDQLVELRRRERASQALTSLQVVRLVPEEKGTAAPPAPAAGPKGAPAEPIKEEPPAELVIEGDEEPPLRVVDVPPAPSAGAALRNEEAEALFRRALAAFREGRASEAVQLFDGFVERFPAHANADRALYWMGEARLEAGSFTRAVADFRLLLSRYPRSSKIPDALFRLGLAYERSGAPDKARQAFEDLVRNYPRSAQSELAQSRLAGPAVGGAR